jgi:hypothetical protein
MIHLYLTLALAFASQEAVAANNRDALVGSTPIVLPDTANLTKRSDESVLRFVKSTLTSGKRLVAVWTDRKQRIRQDRYYPDRHRYAVLYTLTALESLEATSDHFAYAKGIVRDDMAQLQAKSIAGAKLPESLSKLRADLRASGIDPDSGASLAPAAIALLSESDNRLSHLILQSATFSAEGGQVGQAWLVFCHNALLIRRKIVTVNVFSLFYDATDRAWVVQECNQLAQSLLSANE